MSRLRLYCISILLTLTLVACSSDKSTPRLIASYPKDSTQPYPFDSTMVYDDYLEIEVSDLGKAAERATNLAIRYGGYLSSSVSLTENGHKATTLVLMVPAPNLEDLRTALLDLGKLKKEVLTGELTETGPEQWNIYSQVTVHLLPKSFSLPSFPSTGWKPLRTLGNAWSVFITIFGFLMDILIWVVIVLGPFVLLAWGGWLLVRKLSHR